MIDKKIAVVDRLKATIEGGRVWVNGDCPSVGHPDFVASAI